VLCLEGIHPLIVPGLKIHGGYLKWQFAPSFHKIAPPEKMLAYNGQMYYRGYFRAEFVQNSPHSQKSILTPAKIVHIVKKRKHYYILDVYQYQLWKNGSRLNGKVVYWLAFTDWLSISCRIEQILPLQVLN